MKVLKLLNNFMLMLLSLFLLFFCIYVVVAVAFLVVILPDLLAILLSHLDEIWFWHLAFSNGGSSSSSGFNVARNTRRRYHDWFSGCWCFCCCYRCWCCSCHLAYAKCFQPSTTNSCNCVVWNYVGNFKLGFFLNMRLFCGIKHRGDIVE